MYRNHRDREKAQRININNCHPEGIFAVVAYAVPDHLEDPFRMTLVFSVNSVVSLKLISI
jgi:hypothetical protein